MQKSGKGLATGALVLGLVSLVCAALAIFVPAKIGWLCIVALVLGIIAVVLGSKAKKACVAANEPTGAATAGFVCGLLGLILGAIACIVWISCAICVASVINELDNAGVLY